MLPSTPPSVTPIFGSSAGFSGPVWLQAEPAQFVDRVAIDARADGAFTLDYYLGGEGQADAVDVTLLDARGKPVGEPVSVPVAAGRVSTKLSAPTLWTAETPALYTAVVRLKQGATVLHELKQRFGFRTIEVAFREKACWSMASACDCAASATMSRGPRWDVRPPTGSPPWMWI